jgi:hypothetical protein
MVMSNKKCTKIVLFKKNFKTLINPVKIPYLSHQVNKKSNDLCKSVSYRNTIHMISEIYHYMDYMRVYGLYKTVL